MSKTEEEKKLFNKVVIFVFKKLTCSFIKLKLNHCHMDYFNDVIATFLGLEHLGQFCCCLYRVRKLLAFHQKYLKLCSEDERRS